MPVSYTHLDVYKRQASVLLLAFTVTVPVYFPALVCWGTLIRIHPPWVELAGRVRAGVMWSITSATKAVSYTHLTEPRFYRYCHYTSRTLGTGG